MRHKVSLRWLTANVLVAVVVAFQPLMVFAQVADPATSSTNQAQTAAPAGVESTNQSSQQPKPVEVKPKRTYTYNEDTKRWDSDKWAYNATAGNYVPVQPPKPVTPEQSPVAPSIANSAEPQKEVDNKSSTASNLEAVNTSKVENALDSVAQTGSASVTENTNANNAKSGDASGSATVINNLNSSLTNSDNSKAATFVTDIMGDVHGDILIKPMLLKAMLEAEATDQGESNINLKNDTTITNDINLEAQSGDATVAKNTNAGSAETGSANTVANVINIINSMVAAKQSFVGTINIYGNLDGDILIAPDFIPQLLASNAAPGSGVMSSPKTMTVDTKDTQQIINNVNLNATSGSALVENNTSAGSATTGPSSTNTVIFNMTGHEIIAKNSLLVFVNVLGKWVGVIVDAPAGATSAAIANGLSGHTVQEPDMTITTENDIQLINNINLNSVSGNALVAGNTSAGNATSGSATASANIANITNSVFGLTDWFGVLYINVFGDWFGSFGVNTSAGDPIITPQSNAVAGGDHSNQPFEFVPRPERPVVASRAVSILADSGFLATETDQSDQFDASPVLASVKTSSGGGIVTPVANVAPDNTLQYVTGAISALLIISGVWLAVNSTIRSRRLLGTN